VPRRIADLAVTNLMPPDDRQYHLDARALEEHK
jgi:hypothetical protein